MPTPTRCRSSCIQVPSYGAPLEDSSSSREASRTKKNSAELSGALSNSGVSRTATEIDKELWKLASSLICTLNSESIQAPASLTDPTCVEATDHALWLIHQALNLKTKTPSQLQSKVLILGVVKGILWTQAIGLLGVPIL